MVWLGVIWFVVVVVTVSVPALAIARSEHDPANIIPAFLKSCSFAFLLPTIVLLGFGMFLQGESGFKAAALACVMLFVTSGLITFIVGGILVLVLKRRAEKNIVHTPTRGV